MDISLRSMLTAGISAVTATAVVLAPSVTPLPQEPSTQWLPVRLSAAVSAPADPTLNTAERIAPSLFTPPPAPPAVVQPQNAASNVIDSVYSISRYWANYVSLDLGPWLIGWIPFGYLINDQIYIWYPTFVLPVVDSFVYDFLDPVVNNPLNVNVWLDGLGAIANTAGNGVVSGVQQEINYLFSLQWLPFPIPPLPPFPLATTASASFAQADGAATLISTLRDALAQASDRLSDASKKFFGSVGAVGSDAPTTVADRVEVAVEKFQTLAGDLLPQRVDPKVDSGASTDPGKFSIDAPRLLKDVLTPFTDARDELRAVPTADVVDGTESTAATDPGIASSLTVLKERLTKPVTVKQPRNIIREALKAQTGKDPDTGTVKPGEALSNGLKKVAKNVEKAGNAIGKALQGKLKKPDKAGVANDEPTKDTAHSE